MINWRSLLVILAVFFSIQSDAQTQTNTQTKANADTKANANARAEINAQTESGDDARWLYSVRPGDTLWAICLKYTNRGGCWQDLGPINGVEYPRQLPIGYVIEFPLGWLKNQPVGAKVLSVVGDVQLVSGGASRPLKTDELLGIGVQIQSRDGYASIQFGDGSVMVVEPESELNLDALSSFDGEGMVDSRLRLMRGAVRTRVPEREPKSKFRVATPAAVAAVRGTEFRVSTATEESKPTMRGEVFDGTVAVAGDNDSRDIERGYGIKVLQGEPVSEPISLLVAPEISDQSISVKSPVVQWMPVLGAESYQLDVLSDLTTETLLFSAQVSVPEAVTSSLPEGCYTARVRGVSDDQLQGMPSLAQVCVTLPLGVPVLSSHSLEERSGHFTLDWTPVDRAVSYQVHLSADESFERFDVVEVTTVQWQQSASHTDVNYVRVIAVGETGELSDVSEIAKLEHRSKNLILPIVLGVLGLIVIL